MTRNRKTNETSKNHVKNYEKSKISHGEMKKKYRNDKDWI